MPTSATQPVLYLPGYGFNIGQPLIAALANALLVGQSCLLTGTLPTSAGLTITFPQLQAIVNGGAGAAYVITPTTALPITGGASTDNYVYLSTAGAYSQQAVPTGNPAPSTPAGTMCLCVATVNGSNNGTTISPVATSYAYSAAAIAAASETASTTPGPTLQDTIRHLFYAIAHPSSTWASVAVDATEAASLDTLLTGLSNMDRIRLVLSVLLGGANMATMVASGKAAILADGSQSASLVTLASLLGNQQLYQTASVPTDAAQALHLLGNGAFTGQNANGTALGIAVASGYLGDFFSGLLNGDPQMKVDYAGHLLSLASTPTLTVQPSAGSPAFVGLRRGNDMAGCISITLGPGFTPGTFVTVAFGTPYNTPPKAVLLYPDTDGAFGSSGWWLDNFAPLSVNPAVTTTGFGIALNDTPFATNDREVNYIVIG